MGTDGKSYDPIIGLIGNDLDHDALRAVVALGTGSSVDDGAEVVVTEQNTCTKWYEPLTCPTRLRRTSWMTVTAEDLQLTWSRGIRRSPPRAGR